MSAKFKTTGNRSFFLALLTGTAIAAVGILISAALLVYGELPQSFASPLSLGSVCIGTLLGSWLAARIRGANGLVCGAVCGAIYGAVLLAWSIVCCGFLEGTSIVKACVIILFCCFGGYSGMLSAEKRARKHR